MINTNNREYGNWLGTMDWDTFSTVTYKHNISPRRNETIMNELVKSMDSKLDNYAMFWAMEKAYLGNTHNHLLVKNQMAVNYIDEYLLSKNLIDKRFVKHLPYDRNLGASHYVSKYLNRANAQYDLIVRK